MNKNVFSAIMIMLVFIVACDQREASYQESSSGKVSISNRIKVNSGVIANVGVEYRKVRSGKLGTWIPVPGKLLVPREHHYKVIATASGRLRWHVTRYQKVEQGAIVAEVNTPELAKVQQELAAALQNLSVAKTRGNRADSGGKLRIKQAERSVAETFSRLSLLTGVEIDTLKQDNAWSDISVLEIRASSSGFISALNASSGEMVTEGQELTEVVDTSSLLFRGSLPATEFYKIPQKALTQLKLPDASVHRSHLIGPVPLANEHSGKLQVEAFFSNESGALIDEMPIEASVRLRESEYEEALIDEDCAVLDEGEAFVLKRDGESPDWVIRTPIEIGNRSGGMIEVLAGVLEGDEVVCKGIHQLKQISGGRAPEGGHFHADGTWHEGDR